MIQELEKDFSSCNRELWLVTFTLELMAVNGLNHYDMGWPT